MRIRTMAVAVAAAVVLAFAGLPGVASASEVDFPGAGKFTISGGTFNLRAAGGTIQCQSVTGSGQFASKTTGMVQFLFHSCTSEETPCWSTEEVSENGTVKTRILPFHIKTVNGNPAILITPSEEGFATILCVFSLVHIFVSGNGVIGTVTAPAPTVLSPTFTMSFTATGPIQNHKTVDGDATDYHLNIGVNGGGPEEAALVGQATGRFTEGEGRITP